MLEKNIMVPSRPGVYIMKDQDGKVIYVGKAKNLKKRINSYLKEKDSRPQIDFLLNRLKALEFIVTENEKEALILENNLIKKYKPRYNIQLKDDKNYLCIKINIDHQFPKLEFVRKIKNDGALYFGPYTSARSIRDIIDMIGRVYPLRRCSDSAFNKRKKTCIYFDMGECIAPCVNKDKKKDYQQILKEVISFLEGDTKKITKLLEKKMWQKARELDYEGAANLRNLIEKLKHVQEKQGVYLRKNVNIDAIGSFVVENKINFSLLFVRGGSITARKNFTQPLGVSEQDALSQFIQSFYEKQAILPDAILVPFEPEDRQSLTELLSQRFNKNIRIITAKDDETRKLINLANLNASSFFRDYSETSELKNILGLDREIKRIECYDASHMFGRLNLCSMVVYEDGALAKDQYRLFNAEEEGYDDLKTLKNALERRLNHAEWTYPELIVIDGGRSQLSVATKVLKEKGIKSILVVAFAKDENNSLYLPNRKNPLIPKKGSRAQKILSLLREEAHRFANRHLKKRIEKES